MYMLALAVFIVAGFIFTTWRCVRYSRKKGLCCFAGAETDAPAPAPKPRRVSMFTKARAKATKKHGSRLDLTHTQKVPPDGGAANVV